jgi:hypothetical protein
MDAAEPPAAAEEPARDLWASYLRRALGWVAPRDPRPPAGVEPLPRPADHPTG